MPRISHPRTAAPLNKGDRVKVAYRDSNVTIVSDERLTRAQAKRIEKKVLDAWKADAFELGGAKAPHHVRVEVDSSQKVDRKLNDPHGQIFASSLNNSILVRDSLLSRGSGTDNMALAHELGHVQDYAASGVREFKVPTFLREGKEYVLGARYDVRKKTPNPYFKDGAKDVAGLTVKQVKNALEKFRGPDEQPETNRGNLTHDEHAGALFVEWLRTRAQGKGVPDTLARLERVTEAVGNKKTTFAQAFQTQFGFSERTAEKDFLSFVGATERNPQARLQGTIWEGQL